MAVPARRGLDLLPGASGTELRATIFYDPLHRTHVVVAYRKLHTVAILHTAATREEAEAWIAEHEDVVAVMLS